MAATFAVVRLPGRLGSKEYNTFFCKRLNFDDGDLSVPFLMIGIDRTERRFTADTAKKDHDASISHDLCRTKSDNSEQRIMSFGSSHSTLAERRASLVGRLDLAERMDVGRSAPPYVPDSTVSMGATNRNVPMQHWHCRQARSLAKFQTIGRTHTGLRFSGSLAVCH